MNADEAYQQELEEQEWEQEFADWVEAQGPWYLQQDLEKCDEDRNG